MHAYKGWWRNVIARRLVIRHKGFALNVGLKRLIRDLLFHSPLRRRVFPLYGYNFTPAQLCFLCRCIEDTRDIEGAIAEIGCSSGATTIFLNKYIESANIAATYYAMDTFAGFVAGDVDFEIRNRGKTRELFSDFAVNKKTWFDGTMRLNQIAQVVSIEADVNTYDLTRLGPLRFALLDVDLYRPMKKALNELYQVLRPGGIMVVDDCDSSNIKWNGSDEAYKEFMEERHRPCEVVHRKLGIVRKEVR